MSVKMYGGENFDELVQNGVTIVDFYADWCGPCKMIAPVFAKLADELGSIQFVKLNVDNHPQIAQRFQVVSIPTLLIFKNGQLVDKKMGFMPEPLLRSWVESHK